MTLLIATGTADADSADFAVVAGTPATVFLKDAAGPVLDTQARAAIQIKDAGGQYFTVGQLTGANPVQVIDGPGTFRVQKYAGPSFGVDKE
jgi:hypothetical protein